MLELINLGTVNRNRVNLGDLVLWFSYETVVGFEHPTTGRKVRINDWGRTTGKLLNDLEPNKDNRIDGISFEKQLNKLLKKFKLKLVENN